MEEGLILALYKLYRIGRFKNRRLFWIIMGGPNLSGHGIISGHYGVGRSLTDRMRAAFNNGGPGSPSEPVNLPVVVVYDGSEGGDLTAKVEGWQPIGQDEVPGGELYGKLETIFGCYLDAIVAGNDFVIQKIREQLDDAVARVALKLGDEFREGSPFYEFVEKYQALNQALEQIAKGSQNGGGQEGVEYMGVGAIVIAQPQLRHLS